jgi:four helix bundle protein
MQVEISQLTLVALSKFDVYRRSFRLAELVRQIDVRADLRNQMVRAADSVVLNIAESQGRSAGHRAQALETARGSLYETAGALDLAGLSLGETASIAPAQVEARAIAAMLARLCARR